MDNPTATAEQRALWRDIALLSVVPTVLVAGLAAWLIGGQFSFEAPDDSDVFSIAAGTWGWTTTPADSACGAGRHTITFSADRRLMYITQATPWTDPSGAVRQVSEYDILEHSGRHIRGRIRGETRLTDAGEPVAWDLVIRSPDAYQWHRTDWMALGHTARIERCPAGTPPAVAAAGATTAP